MNTLRRTFCKTKWSSAANYDDGTFYLLIILNKISNKITSEERIMDKNKQENKKLNIAIPKGRLYDEVITIMYEAGYIIRKNGRSYRPKINDDKIAVKLFKTQNIPKLVEIGSQDIGFAGRDWIIEQDSDVEKVLDLGLNPVRIVSAISTENSLEMLKDRKVRVATEYQNIAESFLTEKGFDYTIVKSYGATEIFVPEDADMIIDNISTGNTLRQNNLKVASELFSSSTCLIANKKALKDKDKKEIIDDIVMFLRSVILGRKKVLLEMNISKEKIEKAIQNIPCMKSPTVAKLYEGKGFAVKVAVDKKDVNSVIKKLKFLGATDILQFELEKVIP